MAKSFTGLVTSDKADKTITVTVTSRETHAVYGKQYTISRKYAAHDEENAAKLGDKVIIVESRPVSKTKAFRLDKIVEKSRGSIELKDESIVEEAPVKKVKVDNQLKLAPDKVLKDKS